MVWGSHVCVQNYICVCVCFINVCVCVYGRMQVMVGKIITPLGEKQLIIKLRPNVVVTNAQTYTLANKRVYREVH